MQLQVAFATRYFLKIFLCCTDTHVLVMLFQVEHSATQILLDMSASSQMLPCTAFAYQDDVTSARSTSFIYHILYEISVPVFGPKQSTFLSRS